MKRLQSLILFSIGLFVNTIYCLDNEIDVKYEPNWESLDNRPLPQWYDEAKVGIFIHWGVFSVPAFDSEWFCYNWAAKKQKNVVDFMTRNYRPGFTYADFAKEFTAEFFDPDKWAQLFKDSGAKYVVLTSKHHEGYTMWPSKTSWNWNVMDVGPRRDLLGDLAISVRKTGLKFGAYHSLLEFFNPLFLADQSTGYKTQEFVKAKVLPEMKELVNTYKPDVLWSDGEWVADDKYWSATDFLAWLYNERYNPGVIQNRKFENAMSLDRNSWGFRRDVQLDAYLNMWDLIEQLTKTVSCGGNLLINIGPTADGRINLLFEERLRDLGSWLKVNGEAIYSTKPWKHQNDTITPFAWYTSTDKAVYLISLRWPDNNNEQELGALDPTIVSKIELLGVSGELKFSPKGKGTVVTYPPLTPGTALKHAFVLKIYTK
ncbi:unnamed protein product [Medioppia subpectinata]|uniref:alpha-L-fucosidase n=1 Tax=Medioppia subpectinata TaxID=1979941 RepID=A0A7R9Q2R0_9ACAR|nr:unnamed protein product [Medioppia subpectinata]CAG2109681.1 unnamed protein product [Medioppia subpectinata]